MPDVTKPLPKEAFPWLHEFSGFVDVAFGLSSSRATEDELGLVITVASKGAAKLLRAKFKEELGSSTRWGEYPIYMEVSKELEND